MATNPTLSKAQVEDLCVNSIKFLSVDAVEKAKSGHPGTPMGAADLAFVLWSEYLRFDPTDPAWPGRDRFVLSAGHACMLQYSLLHLFGFDLPLEQIQQFRQWGSHTPGHPERGDTPGVEVTTGPLGQGVGNAVGLAVAAKMLSSRLDTNDQRPFSHRVYALAGDGCMMEGVASEAASIAAHLGLDNLTLLYDDNKITIEGSTDLAWSEVVPKRFESYGWHTQQIDGHDRAAVRRALDAALAVKGKPQLILCRTHIANGAPKKHDTASAHGEPLGADEVKATKTAAGWPVEPPFYVPDEARAFYKEAAAKKRVARAEWDRLFQSWRSANPDKAQLWQTLDSKKIPADLETQLSAAAPAKAEATRNISHAVIQKAAELLPSVAGGSADLAPSTKTLINASGAITKHNYAERNFHFGVREHAMGAMLNGIAAHGGFIPYGATFLQFADYMRPAIRLAALMRLQTIYVFTHDSIFLGEDGPTHQPIEHAAALRLIPNLVSWRPADAAETALAWAAAIRRADGPTALLLTRQKLPVLPRAAALTPAQFSRGAYVLSEAAGGKPQLVIAASGSEVGISIEAQQLLQTRGHAVRVVSVPSLETFESQPAEYQESVLPRNVKILAVEAGVPDPWLRHTNRGGAVIGIRRFGASAPAEALAEHFGFTAANVAKTAAALLG